MEFDLIILNGLAGELNLQIGVDCSSVHCPSAAANGDASSANVSRVLLFMGFRI